MINSKITTMTTTRQSRRSELVKEFDQFLRSLYNQYLSDEYKSEEAFINDMNRKLAHTIGYDIVHQRDGNHLLDKVERPKTKLDSPYFDSVFPLSIYPQNEYPSMYDGQAIRVNQHLTQDLYEKINEKLRSYNQELATLPDDDGKSDLEFSQTTLLHRLVEYVTVYSRQY